MWIDEDEPALKSIIWNLGPKYVLVVVPWLKPRNREAKRWLRENVAQQASHAGPTRGTGLPRPLSPLRRASHALSQPTPSASHQHCVYSH